MQEHIKFPGRYTKVLCQITDPVFVHFLLSIHGGSDPALRSLTGSSS